jgi:hypothetical protein
MQSACDVAQGLPYRTSHTRFRNDSLATPSCQGVWGYAPDPVQEKKKEKQPKDFSFFFSFFCKAIQKTLTKLSAARTETIEQLATAKPIQQRLVF